MKKTSMKLSLLILCLGMTAVYAKKDRSTGDDNRSPLGCYDTGYQFDLKTLRLHPKMVEPKQSMYFIFNALNQQINLFQMRDEESSRTLYMNHAINPRQWAVLSTTERKLKFICTTPTPKDTYGKVVDCAQSLRVCQFTNVKYGLNNKGNYWLVHSNTRGGAIGQVIHYGIIPAP